MVARSIIPFCIIALVSISWAAEPEIVELNSMVVVGLQSLISMKDNVISELWTRLEQTGCEIENPTIPGVYFGVSWGYQEQTKGDMSSARFFHMVGAPVDSLGDLPEGFTFKNIPAHRYAKFIHQGSIKKLMDTYNHIFMEWLPNSEYLYHETATDIEWYDHRFKGEGEDSEFDIYIPVIEKTK